VEPQFEFLIPFKLNGAKSRLSSILSPEERRLLALAMLQDVIDVVTRHSYATILSSPDLDIVDVGRDVEIFESDLGLNDAINDFLQVHAKRRWPTDILIVMADLALLTERDVIGILDCKGDVALCPGRGGGTNMILVRDRRFRACYHGLSFPKHLDSAKKLGLKVSIFESFRAGCDIDEPEDLAEVLLHNQQGQTFDLLEKWVFALADDGRAGCIRKNHARASHP
jgi:2-phospho-L-lactate/phosphoenolpyruvate guanylyltransferase